MQTANGGLGSTSVTSGEQSQQQVQVQQLFIVWPCQQPHLDFPALCTSCGPDPLLFVAVRRYKRRDQKKVLARALIKKSDFWQLLLSLRKLTFID